MKKILLLLLMIISVATASAQPAPAKESDIRAIWLNRGLMKRGPEEIKAFLDNAKERGITHVLPNFWFHGCVIYPGSSLAPQHPDFGGWDPMKVVVEEAHARGLKVWPWGEYGFFTHYNTTFNEEDCGWILTHHPDWKIADQTGNTGLRNENMKVMHFSMNPANPAARDFLINLHLDLAKRYDLDGINTDRIRYMNEKWGFDEYSQNAYKEAKSQTIDLTMDQWRQSVITTFQQQFAERWRAAYPTKPITAAVNPPSMYQAKFQYFDEWARNGSLDYAVPMIYGNLNLFKSELQKTVAMLPKGFPVIAGIDAGAGDDEFAKQVHAALDLGVSGVCIWNDEAWMKMKYSFNPTHPDVNQTDVAPTQ